MPAARHGREPVEEHPTQFVIGAVIAVAAVASLLNYFVPRLYPYPWGGVGRLSAGTMAPHRSKSRGMMSALGQKRT